MFKADEIVGQLEWDFHPHVDAKGVSPEPSTELVGAFFDQLGTIFADQGSPETPKDVVAVMAQLSTAQLAAADEKLIRAYADLLSDCPTAEQIGALPHRLRLAFFGWVSGQVTDPT